MKTYVLKKLWTPCPKQNWRDDGWLANCSCPKGHDGPCVWGLYFRHDQKCVAGITILKRREEP